MSHRTTDGKKLRRLRKSLRSQLPAHIDLIDWLKTRRYAQTTGEAEQVILAGRVKSESHTLGIGKGKKLNAKGEVEEIDVVHRLIPADFRKTIRVEGVKIK